MHSIDAADAAERPCSIRSRPRRCPAVPAGASASCSLAPSPAFACRTASRPTLRPACRASGRFPALERDGRRRSRRAPKATATTRRWSLPAAIAARTSCASPRRSSASAGRADRRRRRQGRRHRQPAQAASDELVADRRASAEISRHRLLVPRGRPMRRTPRRRCAPPIRRCWSTAASTPRPACSRIDRIDAGSKLLADNLPADLRGNVADFCAGWGYLVGRDRWRAARRDRRSISMRPISRRWRRRSAISAERRSSRGFFWPDLLSEAGRAALRRDRHEPALPSRPRGRAGDRRRHDPRGGQGAEAGRPAVHGGQPPASLRAGAGGRFPSHARNRPRRHVQGVFRARR